MKVRGIIVIVLALVCGLSAAVGVWQLRKRVERSVVVKPETAPVLVAARDLPRGHVVRAGDVRVAEWPKDLVPPNALSEPEKAVDRSSLVQLLKGEPILDAKLAPKEAGRGLAALIPKGMRAYTIQTSRAASSVAGFVLPGNYVDVLLNLRGGSNDSTGGGSTTTLLQMVEILAVNQDLDVSISDDGKRREVSTVTLLVTPWQAALLDLGQNLGQLTLALRNPEDREAAETIPATLADIRFRQEARVGPVQAADGASPDQAASELAGGDGKTSVPPAPPEPLRIVTLRGNQRGEVAIVSRGP